MTFLKSIMKNNIFQLCLLAISVVGLNIKGAATSSTSRIRSSAAVESDGSASGSDLVDALMYNKAQLALEFAKQETDVNKQVLCLSLLSHAVEKPAYIEVVKELLKKGAIVDLANELDGTTPLMIAIKSGNEAIVSLLLEHGANVNAKCAWGTPLFSVVSKGGSAQIAQKLIDRGADVNPKGITALKAGDFGVDKDITTPLGLAEFYLAINPESAKKAYVELIEVLKKAGAE